jgi:Rho family protein
MGTMQVDSQDSYENVSTKWMSEIQEHCPGVKMVLAALKCDLRTDEQENNNPSAITFDQGLEKAKEIGAVKYLGKIGELQSPPMAVQC